MPNDNMSVETLNRPENTQIQTGSLQEPIRRDAFEATGAGYPVCNLGAHRASELRRQALAEEVRLQSSDFKIYGAGLTEMGVPEEDARRQAKAVRKDYYKGDMGTKKRIAEVLNSMMSAFSGVNRVPNQNQPEPVEVKVDR